MGAIITIPILPAMIRRISWETIVIFKTLVREVPLAAKIITRKILTLIYAIKRVVVMVPSSARPTSKPEKMATREVYMSSKRYPDEFKVEAIKQVADLASRLGVTTHSLYAWMKKYGPRSVEYQAKKDAEAEIRRLKAELKPVSEEPDILKKAAVDSIDQCNTLVETQASRG